MQISAVKSGARVQSPPVQGSCNISAIEQNVTVTGILEDDSHADTCLVGRGFRVVNEHGHSAEVEGFTDRIGTIKLQVVDAITVAKTSEGEDVLLRVNHCLHQPDEERSLLSSFQVRHSGTRIDSTPMQHDDRSLFGIVLDTEKKGRVVIPFSLRGTSAGFMIRTPDDEDLDNLDVFDITSTLAWDPNSLEHAEEEARVQVQKDFTANERMFLTAEMPKDGEVHRVNFSSMWTRSTDALLLPALDEDETSTDESMGSESASARGCELTHHPSLKLTQQVPQVLESSHKGIDIISTLAWDPNSLEYAEEEARVQVQKDFNANERMFLAAEMPKDGEVHRVNLSSMWTRSTDALVLPALDEDETSTDESMGSDSASNDESTTSSDDASRNTYRLRYPKIASRGKRAWPPQGGI